MDFDVFELDVFSGCFVHELIERSQSDFDSAPLDEQGRKLLPSGDWSRVDIPIDCTVATAPDCQFGPGCYFGPDS